MFFNSCKLKVKSETVQERTKLNVDYYKLKDKAGFKKAILAELIGSNLCLCIIDTKLQYNEAKDDIENLIGSLEGLKFPYKQLVVKGEETLKVLGIAMKAPGGKKIKSYIVGFIINADNLDSMKELQESYNIFYFIDDNNTEQEELLNKVQLYYEDEEEMSNGFKLSVLNSNAFSNINIKVSGEKLEYVNNLINQYK